MPDEAQCDCGIAPPGIALQRCEAPRRESSIEPKELHCVACVPAGSLLPNVWPIKQSWPNPTASVIAAHDTHRQSHAAYPGASRLARGTPDDFAACVANEMIHWDRLARDFGALLGWPPGAPERRVFRRARFPIGAQSLEAPLHALDLDRLARDDVLRQPSRGWVATVD
jgi:hypothetical protein